MPDLGSIHSVNLRKIWPHEAHNFTPWLAENLQLLGQAVELDLELIEQESCVGPFFCDLVAKETGSDRTVIIENQLEDANHGHLGQLLTYAAGKDASIVIWIAKEICDEYRQALIWLNTRTDSKTLFFGIELVAFQIDDSRPALDFKIVAAPNEYQKRSAESSTTNSSGPYEKYRTFFKKLIDELREKYHFTNSRVAQPQNWMIFSSGSAGLVYGFNFALGNKARVELYIDFGEETLNKAFFDTLDSKKLSIETDLGEELSWERLDKRRAARIAIYRPGSINDDEATLSDIHSWAIQELLKFKKIFGPMLDKTKAEANVKLIQDAAKLVESLQNIDPAIDPANS